MSRSRRSAVVPWRDWIGTPLFVRGAGELPASGRSFSEQLRATRCAIWVKLGAAPRKDRRRTGYIDAVIAATHALSFTFFPGWIRQQMQLRTQTISLISDSMEACEQIMLADEVHSCCHSANAQMRFEVRRFPSISVGEGDC